VLISEKTPQNPADVFSSAAFKLLISRARKTYDYIVIDTPPVLNVPDARIIGQFTATVLYTVRWNHATYTQVSEGLKQLKSANVDVTGLVLSKV
jgi:Mrp family chromosome partitioning ATPase